LLRALAFFLGFTPGVPKREEYRGWAAEAAIGEIVFARLKNLPAGRISEGLTAQLLHEVARHLTTSQDPVAAKEASGLAEKFDYRFGLHGPNLK
jgi:hypothetical protein